MARQAARVAACALARLARCFCGMPLAARCMASAVACPCRPGRPAHVARRSRCAGQLPRWRPRNRNRRLGKRRRVMRQSPSRRATARTISVIRRSAALVAVAAFAREAADQLPLRGLRTVDGELGSGADAIEPLPDLGILQKGPSATMLSSPCRTVVRQAVLAAATR